MQLGRCPTLEQRRLLTNSARQVIYCAIGVGYKFSIRQQDKGAARGASKHAQSLLPNAEFWGNLFGLVRDGIAFTLGGGAKNSTDVDQKAARATASGVSGAASTEGLLAAGDGDAAAEVVHASGEPTALHVAATTGDVGKLKALLKARPANGLDVDAGDRRQFTAYHQACALGHPECVQALVRAKASTTLRNDVGLTGWEMAQQMKRKDVEKVLLHYASKGNRALHTESLTIPAIV
eukprot:SAG31_NODE_4285_length_3381_cov_1.637112_2_plen_236_part_00